MTESQKLFDAVEKGDLNGVQEALDSGVDIHAQDDYALLLAACYDHIEVVRLLLGYGADVHAGDDRALRIATYEGYFEVVQALLDAGANADLAIEDLNTGGSPKAWVLSTIKLLREAQQASKYRRLP